MKNKYPKIFEPITVKRTTIRNRIAMTPMGTNYGETSGEMSNRHMNYYSLRAKGGTGLIILENANVEYPVGSNGTSQIRIDHDSFMPRYYQLVENLHKNGATVRDPDQPRRCVRVLSAYRYGDRIFFQYSDEGRRRDPAPDDEGRDSYDGKEVRRGSEACADNWLRCGGDPLRTFLSDEPVHFPLL